jgi:hypothetical protein
MPANMLIMKVINTRHSHVGCIVYWPELSVAFVWQLKQVGALMPPIVCQSRVPPSISTCHRLWHCFFSFLLQQQAYSQQQIRS